MSNANPYMVPGAVVRNLGGAHLRVKAVSANGELVKLRGVYGWQNAYGFKPIVRVKAGRRVVMSDGCCNQAVTMRCLGCPYTSEWDEFRRRGLV